MDIGNIWNSLYTSQMLGTQMYGLQSDPFSTYGSYADAWQTSPWQYGLQTGTLYGNNILQTWQNAGFVDTLNDALTRYMETASKKDVEEIEGVTEKAEGNMDISTHEGNVMQLGYDKALVYLPKEQKLMIVKTSENTEDAAAVKSAGNTRTAKASGTANIEEKGILVDQRRARVSSAYRRTQSARQQERTGRYISND